MRFEIWPRNQSRSPRKCWTKKSVMVALQELELQNQGEGWIIVVEFDPSRRKEIEQRLLRISPALAYIVKP